MTVSENQAVVVSNAVSPPPEKIDAKVDRKNELTSPLPSPASAIAKSTSPLSIRASAPSQPPQPTTAHITPAPPLQTTTSSTPSSPASPDASSDVTTATSAAALPGILAGIAKSLATKSAFAMTAFGKGLLKWWFRFPVKLFRPHIVNPWMVVGKMAEKDGRQLNAQYLRGVVAEEGFSVLGKNMLPLLFMNACAGAVLFNVYGLTVDYLASPELELHHPFIAGTLAGASTAVIATPIDNIRSRIDPMHLVDNRKEGMLRFTYRTVKDVLPPGPMDKARVLYKGLGFTAVKDGLGFGMFFGIFEGLRKIGKGAVADFFGRGPTRGHYQGFGNYERDEPADSKGISSSLPRARQSFLHTAANSAVVITAGAAAGMGYQLVIYPVDNIPAVVAAHKLSKIMDPISAEAVAATVAPSYAEDGFHNNNFRGVGAATASGGATNLKGSAQSAIPSFTWREVFQVIRQSGLRPFYKGITPQLIRVMPPSAVGLFAYEVASSQLWDDD
ncbi:hypothetical protein HDV00_007828 [Rhizophlyctis rosea]|nr:hypothetical protein HDV00_007828 [Rhizophlyctis rosea]